MNVDELPKIFLVDSRHDELPSHERDSEVLQSQSWSMVRQAQFWQPPTDVFEFADRLVVRVEIAGMRDGSFHVVLHDRRLLISGTRARSNLERGVLQYHRMEIGYGDFRIEVSLPWPVGQQQATAIYRDGFLSIELPQAPQQQLYVVDVNQSLSPLDSSDDPQPPPHARDMSA